MFIVSGDILPNPILVEDEIKAQLIVDSFNKKFNKNCKRVGPGEWISKSKKKMVRYEGVIEYTLDKTDIFSKVIRIH